MNKGLPRRHLRPMVIAFLMLASAAGLVISAEANSILYSTDFSSDPGWVTNNPYTNHWDQAKGMYHYYLPAAGATYIFKKIPYAGESFRLEYDLFPLKTDFQASFRLGLGNRDMYINQGSTIVSQFENGPYGNIMWLRVIDQSNQRREVSSYGSSGGVYVGPSMRFSDGTPYHVAIEYNRDQKTASIAIEFLGNGTLLWGYTLSDIMNLGPMDRIYISTYGDTGNPSAAAEGDIDNVMVRAIVPPTVTETPPATSSTTLVTGEVTGTATAPPLSRPFTPPPTRTMPVTTPKGIPVPTFLAISALALGALIILASRK